MPALYRALSLAREPGVKVMVIAHFVQRLYTEALDTKCVNTSIYSDSMRFLMTLSIRKLAAPALLAAALMPVAFTAQAGSHQDEDREQRHENMQEQRQQVYQRAEISEEKQQALNEASRDFFEAMTSLREEHYASVAEILTAEEQQAFREAMREVRDEHRSEHRGERGNKHEHSENNAGDADVITQ